MRPWIHFIGSKGKGSSLALIEHQALAAGVPVMVFQSPWIVEEREMFRINGEMLSKKEWTEGLARHAGSLFERAWHASELRMKASPETLKLVECGWETPWDSTASLPPEKWSVLTRIEEEHLELLGGSLEKIVESCLALALPCEKIFCDESQKALFPHLACIWTQAQENPWTPAMNIGLAQSLWAELGETWRPKALEHFSLPGRFEKIHEALYLDACHTLSSLSYALQSWQKIRPLHKKARILFHFLADKHPQLLPTLQAFAQENHAELFWCPLPNEERAGEAPKNIPSCSMNDFLTSHTKDHEDLILGSFRLVALAKTLLPSK